ncbi:MAG: glyoxalase [Marmoricola sp.]|jgi:predicted enzyme related to lactoylglutathione lyase|nr:glyoxalase [Marmoricola sp.]
MTILFNNITFDCADARKLGTFWSTVTGWNLYYDDDPEVVVAPCFPPQGIGLLFIPVPEGKTAKNRIHLDFMPDTGTREEAVEAAVAAGATVIADHRKDDGAGWVVLSDPEGNEFCIERSKAERGPVAPRAFRLGS